MFRLLALLFACSFWGILGLCFLHRRGMLPVGTLLRKCRRMPWLTQAFLALFVWHLVVSGSTKTNQTDNVGGDVTNEPPAGLMMGAPRRGAGRAPYGSDAVQLPRAPSVVWQAPVLGAGEAYSLFSSGTNETFDFSIPSNAVVATNWLAHGAATAWLRIRPADWEFPLGTNVLTEFAVSADGRVMPDPTDTNVCFAPLGVPLGLVPEANWGLLAATDRPSRFWWTLADGDLVCTWENALVGCRAEDPVTFQAAFSPSGNFAYRCDLSRLASGAEGAYSSVSFRSADDAACDAARADLDAILGDADPFAFPPGSTNTVLEHAFYAGSADGRIVFPASTEATAVLRVTATGAGRGELRVGGRVVPLVPRNGSPLALLVAVPKDETQRLYVRGDATLGVALSSDDFAFGILPDHRGGRRTGRINFPNTEATHPCIHSLNARETGVSLPVGADGGDLACAWQGPDDVEIDNFPPRAARITGRFDPRREIPVTYTVSHPRYLFGRTEFVQNARYCPKPPEDDETDYAGRTDPYEGRCWCCHWQTCDTNCTCGCDGCGTWTDTLTNDYEFASTNWPHMRRVLKIRRPLDYSDPCHLAVPTGERRCCPCPEHRTNGVALAYARRVSVVDPSGAEFRSSGEPLTVRIAATEPSYEPDDGTALFATNGAFSLQRDYTCLGVSFSHGTVDLAELNRVNRRFGLPVVVNTNLDEAASVRLNVDVLLRGGRIRLSVEDATTPFEVWRYDGRSEGYAKLADAATPLDLTMAEWRRLTDHESDGCVPSTDVLLVAPHAGKATLVLHYWNVVDGEFVEDESRQTLTAINPPLLPDYNRDGKIDGADVRARMAGSVFRFWKNEDRDKGDYVGQGTDLRPNIERSAELANVKGRYDLANLFPVRLDLASVVAAFGVSATVKMRAMAASLRYCLVDIQPGDAGSIYRSDVRTMSNELLSEAVLNDLKTEWTPLATMEASPQSVFAFEAIADVYPWTSPEVAVYVGNCEVLRYRMDCSVGTVRNMYRWLNVRSACSDWSGEPSRLSSPSGNPDSECDGRHYVFVHGYNVSAEAARGWADQVFKRLWLSGSHSRFTAVDWSGDYSRLGDYSLNYWANVVNAMQTAPELALRVNALQGAKVMLAHSLGNMVTSEACRFHNLAYAKYYMLNAAVPAEAYDSNADEQDNMIPAVWRRYPDEFRSSNWHALFSEPDGRVKFTWRGRYAGISNATNFYSPTEDVLENAPVSGSGGAWSTQELLKGSVVMSAMSLMSCVCREAGWGFNQLHTIPMSQDELLKTSYTDDEMMTSPPFLPFAEDWLHVTNTLSTARVEAVLPRILADGIPATTFAAGANQIGGVADNISYHAYMTNLSVWPDGKTKEGRLLWEHSDIKNLAYLYVYQFYERIVEGR